MLHNFLRSLGRPSHKARLASRRKFSPHALRSETAIERLEERMLLSGTGQIYERTMTYAGWWAEDSSDAQPLAVRAQIIVPSDGHETASAWLKWSIVDDRQERRTLCPNNTITFDGQTVVGTQQGWSRMDSDAPVYYATFTADITELLKTSSTTVHEVSAVTAPTNIGPEGCDLLLVRNYAYQNSVPTVEDRSFTYRCFDEMHSFAFNPIYNAGTPDPDGDWISCEIVSGPSDGELVPLRGGGYTLTAPVGFEGELSFTYRAWDGHDYSNTATVTVNFLRNHLPTVEDKTYVGTAHQPIVGQIEWNDPDGDLMMVMPQQLPTAGTLFLDPNSGEFVYTPPENFVGTATFTYRVAGRGRTDIHSIRFVIGASGAQTENMAMNPASDASADSLGRGQDLDVLDARSILLPPTSRSHRFKPVRVTAVVYSTEQIQVNRALAASLRMTRLSENGLVENDSNRPIAYEFRDVNGDGREDLVATFLLDWAALKAGYAEAFLTARAGWQNEQVADPEPEAPKPHRPVPPRQEQHPGHRPHVDMAVAEPASDPVVQPSGEAKERQDSKRFEASIHLPPTEWPSVSHPSRAAFSILSTDTLDAKRIVFGSLSVGRVDANSGQLSSKDRSIAASELRHVNGDGLDDLVDVFELDWAELWDGYESAVLTVRRV